MNLALLFGGDPAQWVPSQGRPASCLGFHGMPSLESANQRVEIFTSVIMRAAAEVGWIMAPHDYQDLSETHPGGMIRGRWRPKLYHFYCQINARGGIRNTTWRSMGSQHELWWRRATAGHSCLESERRARQILLDNLTEHQILEYALTDNFTVIGGRTGNTYLVQNGNGFSLISRNTREELVSYCLHPEDWMPHPDVALATKLGLECPETEEAMLNRATAYPRREFMRALLTVMGDVKRATRYPRPRKPTRIERYTADMERELI